MAGTGPNTLQMLMTAARLPSPSPPCAKPVSRVYASERASVRSFRSATDFNANLFARPGVAIQTSFVPAPIARARAASVRTQRKEGARRGTVGGRTRSFSLCQDGFLTCSRRKLIARHVGGVGGVPTAHGGRGW